MIPSINATHDPDRRSWVPGADAATSDFPIQNLPFGVFRRRDEGSDAAPRVGVAIGSHAVDVAAWLHSDGDHLGRLDEAAQRAGRACAAPDLAVLMGCDPADVSALRAALVAGLDAAAAADARIPEGALVATDAIDLLMPAEVGDYTDFYCSIHHATNVGSMFRPDNPLMPNYKHLPVGYHGRASSLVVSGTPIRRPQGQTKADDADAPTFGPSKLLDYEMEVGFFVGPGNALGEPIALGDAGRHIFGLCLVNDWSARDVQKWEYQPLGPFLAKSFATSLSPWVVTAEALAPFRVPAFARAEDDPQPLPHLDDADDRGRGGIDLQVEVHLDTAQMRDAGVAPVRLSRGSFRDMYWTIGQMLTHHASAGCNLRPADLMASGTVSGPEKANRGCLLELTWRGQEPIELPTGEVRRFLQDGDGVTLRGFCEAAGARRIGFGSCHGVIAPAHGG